MKHTKRKISKIVDEMLNYLFHIGGSNIQINIKEDETLYEIKFQCDFNEDNQHCLVKLCKCLNCERNEQMESYYWELAGETETDTELSLIGMMIDNYFLDLGNGQLELKLIRQK